MAECKMPTDADCSRFRCCVRLLLYLQIRNYFSFDHCTVLSRRLNVFRTRSSTRRSATAPVLKAIIMTYESAHSGRCSSLSRLSSLSTTLLLRSSLEPLVNFKVICPHRCILLPFGDLDNTTTRSSYLEARVASWKADFVMSLARHPRSQASAILKHFCSVEFQS